MIRLAEHNDLIRIMEIYRIARAFMKQNGNETQWGANHPPQDVIENDILNNQLFVYVEDDIIHGVFAFIIGDDPAYTIIENGAWLNGAPYGAIHRVASSGEVKGIFSECLNYCKECIDNIRIDTHENNTVMQRLLIKHGFIRCGTIYVQSGSPRIAYQYVK